MSLEKRLYDLTPRNGYILPLFHDDPVIFQGNNGPYSHFITRSPIHDDRFAIDFAVPPGTFVVAAKEGTVLGGFSHVDSYYEKLNFDVGRHSETNFIVLQHKDGTYTIYSHLAKEGLLVDWGEQVKRGQIIARTGLSGWIGPVPHLHFEPCFTITRKSGRFSFPIKFCNYSKPLEHSMLQEEMKERLQQEYDYAA